MSKIEDYLVSEDAIDVDIIAFKAAAEALSKAADVFKRTFEQMDNNVKASFNVEYAERLTGVVRAVQFCGKMQQQLPSFRVKK